MSKRSERRLKWALSIGVVVVAIAAAVILVATKVEPPRAEKPLEGTLVDVIQVRANRHEVDLRGKGSVPRHPSRAHERVSGLQCKILN